MPAQRRDDEGRWQVGRTWESLVDRQIREAMEDGRFDDLPYQGERLPIEDDDAAGEWASAFRILRHANVAPGWIEADKEVRRLLDRRDAIRDRATRSSPLGRRRDREELERVVHEHARAVASLNALAPTDRQHRRPLDLEAELEELARLHANAERR
jgi:DnaJ-like protein